MGAPSALLNKGNNMPALTVTKEELLACGAREKEIEDISRKIDTENNTVQIVDIVDDLEVETLFTLIENKRGLAVLRQFFADCCMLDPDYARSYARTPVGNHKMKKQIEDPQGRHGGPISSLAAINIRRYRFEKQMIDMPNFDKAASDHVRGALVKLSALLTVIFVVPA